MADINVDKREFPSVERSQISTDFIKPYDVVKRVFNESGNGVEDVYEKRVDEFGAVSYVKTGEKNLYEEIQAFKDDTDINFIIARCVKEDTIDLLADHGAKVVDMSNLPDNFLDMYNLYLKIGDEFKNLPLEERQIFNNNPVLYADSRFNGSAIEAIESFRANKAVAESVDNKKEVKDE